MKKVTIIDHYSQLPGEKGNNRFIYLAEILTNNRYEVEIFTTVFSHKEKKKRDLKLIDLSSINYNFKFFSEPGYKRNVSIKRLFSNTVFGYNVYRYLIKHKSFQTDLFYIAVPSLTVAGLVSFFAKKRGIPVIVDIQDIWPQAFKLIFNPPLLGAVIYSPQMFLSRYIYKNASAIVAVSNTYLEVVSEFNVPKLCVFLGTDLEKFNIYINNSSIVKSDDEFWIIYIGTLGHSYNLEVIFDALGLLDKGKFSNLVFKILGDGPLMEQFRQSSVKSNVRIDFLGRLDYPLMVEYLSKADIAVNPIVEGATQSIINKVGDYAAAGLPVINTQECKEYRNLVSENNLGFNCKNDNPKSISDKITLLYKNQYLRKLQKKNQLDVAAKFFNRKTNYNNIINLIIELLSKNFN